MFRRDRSASGTSPGIVSPGAVSGGAVTQPGELPLVHRMAIAYLLTPVAVWLLGWFHWWVGLPVATLLGFGAWSALSGSWRWRRPSRTTVVLALAAAVWVMVTPAGGVFTVSDDWSTHRAILLDMTRGGWPTYPVDHLRDSPPLLRYYLGWHMAPTLLGRWLGPAALNWAVPLWTWLGVALVVLLFARGLPTLRAALLAAGVLVFFSGMDVVELALREGVPDAARMIRDKLDPDWAPIGQDRRLTFVRTATSPMLLEYLSHNLTLAHTPQHFLPAGLATLLMLRLRERRRFLQASGVVLASCLFWSPLLATGLLPLAVAMLVGNRNARHAASWQNVFVALPLVALIALYLASGATDFDRGWLWELYDDRLQLVGDILVLYATEFLVLAALLWRLDPRIVRNPFFVASVLALLTAPWYWYGTSQFSEWSLRFSVPALVVLARFAACAVVGRSSGKHARGRLAYRTLLAVLAIGALTVVWELGLLMHNPRLMPYETLGNSVLIDQHFMDETNKTTRTVPKSLALLLRNHEVDERRHDKGTLLIRSAWDVYLRDNRLVYAKRRCNRGDGQARTRFYVDIQPAGPQAPGAGGEIGYDRLTFGLISPKHFRETGGCVVPFQLPAYDIAQIRTGQIAPDGRRLWEAEAHLRPQ